ncbi:M48 family peptidase [Sphingorhabdus pulchriflava]|uniref:M48 family peptidase n=1 Tax=Sphingorhabdus pulchriflava TaxID=2292257 RepID=A0A371BE92_9SPHN|nr:M48 family metalloprotease [Sphingorhabdus pulchriflava]RDV05929.1 M48 family peptidase [Sphingorhabdus pulchriflava]
MTFNPAAETARYIDSLGPEALQKAANYTSGGHWMLLWGLAVSAVVTLIMVRSRILDRVAVRFEKRGRAFRTWLIAMVYFLSSALLTLPWTLYEDYFREKSYGRTSQPLADFLVQDAMGTMLFSIFGGLFFLGVYALIRRTGKKWWLWSGGLGAAAITVTILLSPLLIEPLFNNYKPVPEGPVRTALVEMGAEAGIAEDRIVMFDGSRQSNNFTANVSGVFGTGRIAISDVALKQASLDEVKAVTGHEIGHYVLGHVWRFVFLFSGMAIVGFFLTNLMYDRVASMFGSKAQIGDPEGLPIIMFTMSLLFLFAQPLNGVIRMGESEADDYSLRTVNLPDALAGALIKTAEYRYPRPSAIEEAIFYSHPSIERRIRNAMEWKAKGLEKAVR